MTWQKRKTEVYLNTIHRHAMCCELADYGLKSARPSDIVALCPEDYGGIVSDDHRNFLWDRYYEEAAMLDDYALSRKYEELLHPERDTAKKFSDPSTWVKDRKLCN